MSKEESKKAGSGKVDREQLLAAIRAAVKTTGKEPFSLAKFVAVSKMTIGDVKRFYSKWSDALKAAKVNYERYNAPVDSNRLLADWGMVTRKLGRIPTIKEYAALGECNISTLKVRFGSAWAKVIAAFREFATKNSQWMDVLEMLPEPGREDFATRRRKPGNRGTPSERLARRQALVEHRQISGDPLYCEGISHAPVNETGVIMLFGAMAAKLGFMVESVRANFPDCQAKRRIGPDAWLTLRIEFEYESRNFRDHGHPPEGCDMIVCWVHNWSDCPPNLKVIALSEELARLRRERMMLAF